MSHTVKPSAGRRIVRTCGPPHRSCRTSRTVHCGARQENDQRVDRRKLAAFLSTCVLSAPSLAWADEAVSGGGTCFIELSVDGDKQGRVVIELYDATSVGCRRFSDLCKGIEGVGFKREKVDAIYKDKFVRSGGVAALSYGDTGCPIAGGETNAPLLREMASSTRRHDAAGVVSLVVKPTNDIVETTKLVAEKGKLVEIIERSGVVPNGTGFAITVAPAPVLDATNLVVGRVVDGLDLITRVSELPVVKDNSGSPFLKAGKAIGDKRANVAELGFNRPFNKVVVSAAGLL